MLTQPETGQPALRLLPDERRRDATRNREALLRAAQDAIAEDPNASLGSIAQAAGLTRRALYGHFPDRESLLREVIGSGARQFRAIAEEASSEEPRLALAQLARGLWNAATAVRASANISLADCYRDEAAQALEPLRASLGALARSGIAAGAFRADMTAGVLALLIEEAARAVLRDGRIAVEDDAGGVVGASAATAIKVVLSIAGLSWREQAELFAEHPELLASSVRLAG